MESEQNIPPFLGLEILPFLEEGGVRSVRLMLSAISDGVLVCSTEGHITYANRACLGMLGFGEADLVGRPFPELVVGRWREALLDAALNGDVAATDEVTLSRRNGAEVNVLLTAIPLSREDQIDGVLLVFRDLTPGILAKLAYEDRERMRTRNELEMTLALNHQINGLLRALLTEHGAGNTIETALNGALQLTQAEAAAIGRYDLEKRCVRYSHSAGFDEPLGTLEIPLEGSSAEIMFKTGEPLSVLNYTEYERRNEVIARRGVRSSMGAPLMADGEPLGVISLFRMEPSAFGDDDRRILMALVPVLAAALQKARYEHRLSVMATRDSLTGLWNRRIAFESLDREVKRAKRYDSVLTCILLDLDHFKEVNDTHGHLAGDAVLRVVARVMGESFRSADVVARTGGEEFMILLPETSIAGAKEAAEKLRRGIEEAQIAFGGTQLKVTASLGCAAYQAPESEEEFFARLDRLLYRSKDEGRNRVTFQT